MTHQNTLILVSYIMINFQLHDFNVVVIKKKIKNMYLNVCPTEGVVKVSAPNRMSLEMIKAFIVSKSHWIKNRQEKLFSQERAVDKEYVDGESHYFNGERYSLKLIEHNAAPTVCLTHAEIVLQVRPNTDKAARGSMLDAWYRQKLKEKLHELFPLWEMKIGVSIAQFKIRKMKTRWGSCSPSSKSIRINFELIKKPPECLEYIVVHELVHLLEPSHNKRFVSLMDSFLPNWRFYRKELNSNHHGIL